MKNTLEGLFQSIKIEVENSISEDFNDWIIEDYFTSLMGEYLSEIGEVDDITVCSFRDVGIQLNGYNLSSQSNELNLFISHFSNVESIYNIQKSDVESLFKRGINFYRKSINNLMDNFRDDIDIIDIANFIFENRNEFETVRIILLTNGVVKNFNVDEVKIGDVSVKFVIWDIDRLYRCINSGKMREVIEIDLEKEFECRIEAISTNIINNYKVYLATINGEILAKIYDKYGSRLLEKNVRSFLQVKGQVNKGIRKTLVNEPDMFLAYNNGLSVVADKVEESNQNGKVYIKKITDMQIVNGGQTTASIHSAYKDSKCEVNFENVFVQVKITVIENGASDSMIPNISAYSNTQNKIQVADFSANDPFHRKLEELSRTIWTSNSTGSKKPVNWFYERARGQYTDALMKITTIKKKKEFQADHPLFTKTDLAKYENAWNQMPFYVCEGAQKNFKKFVLRLSERGKYLPDQKYYETLIAKAILYKKVENIVKNQKYEAYRSNITAYTFSFISFITKQCLNLDEIWKYQSTSIEVDTCINEVSMLIYNYFLENSKGKNLGEWTKTTKCWEEIKKIEYIISDELNNQLIKIDKSTNNIPDGINTNTEEEKEIIDKVTSISANTWFKLSKWAKETSNFQPWQRKISFTIGTLINKGKMPTYKQAYYAFEMYKESVEKGFN